VAEQATRRLIKKANEMLQKFDDGGADSGYEDLLPSHNDICQPPIDRVSDEINAYTAAETPDERAAALDALAKKLNPNADSRVAAVAELQRRGILKVPAQPLSTTLVSPERGGWTGCEKGYVARVVRQGGTGARRTSAAFYAVIAHTEDAALSAVRQAVRPGDDVEIMNCRLLPETAKALRLRSGIASDVTRALCPAWCSIASWMTHAFVGAVDHRTVAAGAAAPGGDLTIHRLPGPENGII
jgi:hypothetical protein